MKKYISFCLIIALFCLLRIPDGYGCPDAGNISNPNDIIGRWDLTIEMNTLQRAGWLEVTLSGNTTLIGRIMVIGGSARPISEVHESAGKYSFSIPVQWESGSDLSFEASVDEDMIRGSMIYSDGKTYQWSGVRAPRLRREEPQWGVPVQLFNGYSMAGWVPMTEYRTGRPDQSQWVAKNGILTSPHAGANLRTEEVFQDFKLHVEFRYAQGGNSGVYLRGRYEVQVADSYGKDPDSHLMGGVYGFLTPSDMVAKKDGNWQSFDITLVGRMITVVANGVTIICNQEIPGPTGGAIDSNESEPGPIYLQGDHQPIEYRNIEITLPKE